MEKKVVEDIVNLKPFRLVKFFSFTSLAVILITSIALSLIISNYTKDVVLERNEAYLFVLAEKVGHQVFQEFVLPLALQNRPIAVEDPRQFKQLDKVVRSATAGLNIHSVTIYSKKENQVAYSTISELVGRKDVGEKEYERALQGKASPYGTLMVLFSIFFPGAGKYPASCTHLFLCAWKSLSVPPAM